MDNLPAIFSKVLLKADLNFIVLQTLDGRSIRVDEAGKGSRRQSGQYASRGGGRFGGGSRGRGGRGFPRGGKASCGVRFFLDVFDPFVLFCFLPFQATTIGTSETDMTEGSAVAAAATGGTAVAAAVAAAATEVVAAAGDTPVATEIISRVKS